MLGGKSFQISRKYLTDVFMNRNSLPEVTEEVEFFI